MNNYLAGRDSIRMLKEIFGINQDNITSITVTASIHGATDVTVSCLATDGASVKVGDPQPCEESHDYIVHVRRKE